MTGLDIEKDRIIEMACIITDSDLNIIAEGPTMIINQPDELLNGMSNWCKEHHGKVDTLSGLSFFLFLLMNHFIVFYIHTSIYVKNVVLAALLYYFALFVPVRTDPGCSKQ
ncbi:hypothetical protein AMECASPLE_037893 [Ameca splendens]|uniref:Exonuclease domain-containing protein n=1 Tax=Ameca splendens TaxID=208324 RepID=A0ABV0Y8K5_9TELE